MKKVGIAGIVASLIVIIGLGTYVNYYNTDVKPFMVKGTDLVMYSEKDSELEKEFEDIVEKTEKLNMEILGEELLERYMEFNENSKYIERTFLIHTEQDFKKIKKLEDLDIFFGVNAGKYYLPAFMKLSESFDKTESENYVLKKELQKDVIDIILKSGEVNEKSVIDRTLIEDTKVYMIPFKSYFIFAFSEEKLKDYLEKVKSGEKSKRISEEYEEVKKENKNILIVDLEKNVNVYLEKFYNGYVEKLDFFEASSNYNYQTEEIEMNANLKGKGKIFELLDSSQINERNLEKYIDANRLYFSNNSFQNIALFILEEMKKKQGTDINMFAKMFLGKNIDEIVNSLGDEIVIAFDNNSVNGVINLRDKKMITDIFEKLGLQGENGEYDIKKDYKLLLKEKVVFLNKELEERKEKIELPKDTFLYLEFDFGKIFKMAGMAGMVDLENLEELKNMRYKLIGNSSGQGVNIKIKLEKDVILDIMDMSLKNINKK